MEWYTTWIHLNFRVTGHEALTRTNSRIALTISFSVGSCHGILFHPSTVVSGRGTVGSGG